MNVGDGYAQTATSVTGSPMQTVKPAPVRDELSRAVARIGEELGNLETVISPILAQSPPPVAERLSSPHPYMSEVGGQVASLHDLADAIAALTRRVEL